MACCGLCRPKIKTPITKTQKSLTRKKVETINQWMEAIEGPYSTIELPTQSPKKTLTITNKDEIVEFNESDLSISSSSLSSETV